MWFYIIYICFTIVFAFIIWKLYSRKHNVYYSISAIYAILCIGLQFAYSVSNHSDQLMFMFLISCIPAQIQFLFSMIYINIDYNKSLCAHIIMISCVLSYVYLFVQKYGATILALYMLSAIVISCIYLTRKHSDWRKSRIFMNGTSLVIGSLFAHMIVCCTLDFLLPYAMQLWSI